MNKSIGHDKAIKLREDREIIINFMSRTFGLLASTKPAVALETTTTTGLVDDAASSVTVT